MSLDHDDMAPSPEQPLNGQGVLGISRLDGHMATASCDLMEMVQANSLSSNHLPSTSSHDRGDMEDAKSGQTFLCWTHTSHRTDAQHNNSSSDTDGKSKAQKKKKTKARRKHT